jgi:Mce-associated membrane protein
MTDNPDAQKDPDMNVTEVKDSKDVAAEVELAESAPRGDEAGVRNGEITPKRGRGIAGRSVGVKTLAFSVLILGLVVALIVTTWMLVDKSNELDAVHTREANEARAEQVAMDYAVGAAAMDYKNTAEWKERLTKGTSPALAERLTQAATSMEQITAPLQWTSTSTPISATVRSIDGAKYVVDCFVNVLTKNTQAPEGVQSTATYSVTIDGDNDWLITDVGGIGAILGDK